MIQIRIVYKSRLQVSFTSLVYKSRLQVSFASQVEFSEFNSESCTSLVSAALSSSSVICATLEREPRNTDPIQTCCVVTECRDMLKPPPDGIRFVFSLFNPCPVPPRDPCDPYLTPSLLPPPSVRSDDSRRRGHGRSGEWWRWPGRLWRRPGGRAGAAALWDRHSGAAPSQTQWVPPGDDLINWPRRLITSPARCYTRTVVCSRHVNAVSRQLSAPSLGRLHSTRF